MGCGNPKEKLEDEMMKIKMSRIEIQMERYNQLQLLKSMNGGQIKTPTIPDYIDQKFLKNYLDKNKPSSLRNTSKEGTINRRPKRSKSTKSFVNKKKEKIFNFDEESQDPRKLRRRYTFKRKTFKF